MTIKVTKRNVKMTPTMQPAYRNLKTVQRAHVPNLRFGKVSVASDADVDG